MTVRANKPAFNVREKIKELDYSHVPYEKINPGGIVQVVQSEFRSSWSNTTTTPAKVTGLSTVITPKFASSKMLIRCDVHLGQAYWQVVGRLYKDGVRITDAEGIQEGNRPQGWFTLVDYGDNVHGSQTSPSISIYSRYEMQTMSASYVDTANTVSPITYDLYVGSVWSTNYPTYVNRQHTWNNGSGYTCQPISTMTIMEIKQ